VGFLPGLGTRILVLSEGVEGASAPVLEAWSADLDTPPPNTATARVPMRKELVAVLPERLARSALTAGRAAFLFPSERAVVAWVVVDAAAEGWTSVDGGTWARHARWEAAPGEACVQVAGVVACPEDVAAGPEDELAGVLVAGQEAAAVVVVVVVVEVAASGARAAVAVRCGAVAGGALIAAEASRVALSPTGGGGGAGVFGRAPSGTWWEYRPGEPPGQAGEPTVVRCDLAFGGAPRASPAACAELWEPGHGGVWGEAIGRMLRAAPGEACAEVRTGGGGGRGEVYSEEVGHDVFDE
jgi:hypothetical protein